MYSVGKQKKSFICPEIMPFLRFLVLKKFFPHKMKVIINDFKTVHSKQMLAASYQSLETISLKHFTLYT